MSWITVQCASLDCVAPWFSTAWNWDIAKRATWSKSISIYNFYTFFRCDEAFLWERPPFGASIAASIQCFNHWVMYNSSLLSRWNRIWLNLFFFLNSELSLIVIPNSRLDVCIYNPGPSTFLESFMKMVKNQLQRRMHLQFYMHLHASTWIDE